MRRSLLRGVFFLALAATTAAACDSEQPGGPTAPPTPIPVTETFTGTLTVNGAVTFPFTVSQAGSANASVTALSPDSAAILGIGLGTWSGTTCSIVLANDIASVGSVVTGAVQSSGSLCARVYDVGQLTAPTTFTINVSHF